MPAPFLKIPRLEHVLDESQKAVVVDILFQNVNEHFVVESPKRSINSMPWSRTQINKIQQKLRLLTPATRSLGTVSR
jgi:hypothetical protein